MRAASCDGKGNSRRALACWLAVGTQRQAESEQRAAYGGAVQPRELLLLLLELLKGLQCLADACSGCCSHVCCVFCFTCVFCSCCRCRCSSKENSDWQPWQEVVCCLMNQLKEIFGVEMRRGESCHCCLNSVFGLLATTCWATHWPWGLINAVCVKMQLTSTTVTE